MTRFAADTSCLIAAMSGWHPKHLEILGEIQHRLGEGECFCVVAHTIFETYSVLTRLPSPHRLSSSAASRLVIDNLSSRETLRISPAETWQVVEELAASNVIGGATYDGIVAWTAKRGGVKTLLTLNPKDFRAYEDQSFSLFTA